MCERVGVYFLVCGVCMSVYGCVCDLVFVLVTYACVCVCVCVIMCSCVRACVVNVCMCIVMCWYVLLGCCTCVRVSYAFTYVYVRFS